MGWLASAMPSPVPCNSRITEVRSLPYAELCCLDDARYYAALRLPPHCPRFRFGLIPGHASAAIDFADGCGRAAPESKARAAAFAQLRRARPARSLTGCSFVAAEFTYVAACSFASPRFNARLSSEAGG